MIGVGTPEYAYHQLRRKKIEIQDSQYWILLPQQKNH